MGELDLLKNYTNKWLEEVLFDKKSFEIKDIYTLPKVVIMDGSTKLEYVLSSDEEDFLEKYGQDCLIELLLDKGLSVHDFWITEHKRGEIK